MYMLCTHRARTVTGHFTNIDRSGADISEANEKTFQKRYTFRSKI